jgi:hypothetical protein
VQYSSFGCAVQLVGVCSTVRLGVQYSSFGCAVQLVGVCCTVSWGVQYSSFGCAVQLVGVCTQKLFSRFLKRVIFTAHSAT